MINTSYNFVSRTGKLVSIFSFLLFVSFPDNILVSLILLQYNRVFICFTDYYVLP